MCIRDRLKGECFHVHVKEGDRVSAGDLLAEVDLDALKEKGLNPVTPVLVCDGLQNRTLNMAEGEMKAGETELLLVLDECCAAGASEDAGAAVPEAASEKAAGASGSISKKEKKKFPINFDFLQKLGKVLMTVIAVMPAAGLMISIGTVSYTHLQRFNTGHYENQFSAGFRLGALLMMEILENSEDCCQETDEELSLIHI